LPLVEQQHEAEVADSLFGKTRRRDQLDALHLPEMRRVAEHVNVQQLGDIPVTQGAVGGCLKKPKVSH
jgi:hypothetical protein